MKMENKLKFRFDDIIGPSRLLQKVKRVKSNIYRKQQLTLKEIYRRFDLKKLLKIHGNGKSRRV